MIASCWRFRVVALVTPAVVGCSTENQLASAPFAEPDLALTSPAAAAWMDAEPVDVTGRAENLTDVTITRGDDVLSAAVDDDHTFTTELELERGINVVEARGTDQRGDLHYVRHGVIAGEFADPGNAMDDAVQMRVNQGGLDVLVDLASEMLDPVEIGSSIQAMNPVYEDAYGVLGWDAVTIRADVGDLYFDPPSLEASPASGVLTLEAEIPNLWLSVYASGDVVGWDFGEWVWIWADSADITGRLTVEVDDGELVVELREAEVELANFGFDTSILPTDVEGWLLADTVRGMLEEQLVDQIEAQVPALIEEQLAALDLSFETELLERTLAIEASFASASVDPDGLVLALDLDVDVPSSGTKVYSGYLTADARPAETSHTADLGLSLSDDMLNRVLFEAWRSGMLDVTLSTEDGSLDPILLTSLQADAGSISINAALPPVIVESEGGLQAQIGELLVTIQTPGGAMGEHLLLAVSVFVELEVAVDDGSLSLEVGSPTLSMMVRESDWGASNEATTQLIEQMLPIDTFLLLLADLSFPIPELGGVSIEQATVTRDDSGVYTGIDVQVSAH
jgi:hypothetical protein